MQEEITGRDRLIITLQAELASMEERITTMEHDLHDGPLQRVIAARMEIEGLLGTPELNEDLLRQLEDLGQSLQLAIGQVRDILHGSGPTASLIEGGVEALCSEFTDPTFQGSLEGESSLEELEQEVSEAILCIVRELIWNARRHSGATEVKVLVYRDAGHLFVEVVDQGKGSLPDQIPESSFGLCTAIQRARIYDLDLEIDSVPGTGTHITIRKALG